jgi:hypothetical protein
MGFQQHELLSGDVSTTETASKDERVGAGSIRAVFEPGGTSQKGLLRGKGESH